MSGSRNAAASAHAAAQREAGPATPPGGASAPPWTTPLVVQVTLLASLAAFAVAPWAMDAGYSVLGNTISESAAQQTPGAAVGRAGFLLFGLSVLGCAPAIGAARGRLAFTARLAATAYGVGLLAVGVYSSKPWQAGTGYDPVEDTLHSLFAFEVGLAYCATVAAVALGRRRAARGRRLLDAMALSSALIAPLVMLTWPGVQGLAQRAMFALALAWFAAEAAGQ